MRSVVISSTLVISRSRAESTLSSGKSTTLSTSSLGGLLSLSESGMSLACFARFSSAFACQLIVIVGVSVCEASGLRSERETRVGPSGQGGDGRRHLSLTAELAALLRCFSRYRAGCAAKHVFDLFLRTKTSWSHSSRRQARLTKCPIYFKCHFSALPSASVTRRDKAVEGDWSLLSGNTARISAIKSPPLGAHRKFDSAAEFRSSPFSLSPAQSLPLPLLPNTPTQ